VSVNEVGYVDAKLPKSKVREDVTDEVSTQPGLEVTVKADGSVRVKKKPDPNWNEGKGEPLSEASEDDDSDGEDKPEAAKVEKKTKAEKKADKKAKKKAEKKAPEMKDKAKASKQVSDIMKFPFGRKFCLSASWTIFH
jgi:hypothetical protein